MRRWAALALMMCLLVPQGSSVVCRKYGPNAATVMSSYDDSSGGTEWNIYVGPYAAFTAGLTATTSEPLLSFGFGFDVPADRRIGGLAVDVSRRRSSGLASCTDEGPVVAYSMFGAAAFPSKSGSWSGTASFGGPEDTGGWNGGLGFMVNSSLFGVSLKGRAGGTTACRVDAIYVTVYACGLCAPDVLVDNGLVQFSGHGHEDTANVTCNSNYTLVGPQEVQCYAPLDDAAWPPLGRCEPACMTGAVLPPNATGGCQDLMVEGETCNITCIDGTVVTGPPNICTNFSIEVVQSCVLPCDTPPNPPNGSLGSCEETPPGSFCSIECIEGFSKFGDTSLCLGNGTTIIKERCVADCVVPSLPPNATAGTCAPGVRVGDSCDFACEDGFYLEGSTNVCGSDSVLDVTQSCSEIPVCEDPILPANVSSSTCSSVMVGENCTFSCSLGYDLVGGPNVCLPNRVLNVSQQCLLSVCPEPVAPPNATLGGCAGGLPSGSACSFSCNDGYYLQGPPGSCISAVFSSIQRCQECAKVEGCIEGVCSGLNTGLRCTTCRRGLEVDEAGRCRVSDVEAATLPSPVLEKCEPDVLPLSPSADTIVRLTGKHLSPGASVFINGVRVIKSTGGGLEVRGLPSRDEEGYLQVVVMNPLGATFPRNATHPGCIFVSDSNCILPGVWLTPDGKCEECPHGGECPGGGRVWPKAGYWSQDERSEPRLCKVPEACPGAVEGNIKYNENGQRVTSQCATELGYSGVMCDECRAGYFRDGPLCETCGTSAGAKAVAKLLIFVAALLACVLAVIVVVLPDGKLDTTVSLIMGIQPVVVMGRAAVVVLARDDSQGARTFFRICSIVLFEVDFLQPGCNFGAFPFWKILLATVMIIFLTWVLFFVACIMRGLVLMCMNGRLSLAVFAQRVVRRFIRASVILASIVYLQLSIRTMQAVHCVDVDGTRRLKVELRTVCYEGSHVPLAVCAFVLLAFVYLGVPCAFTAIVYRARLRITNPEFKEKFGYLTRGLKKDLYFFRLLTFAGLTVLAMETVLSENPSVAIFASACVFVINFVLVGVLRPFSKSYVFYLTMGGGLAKIIYSITMLAIMGPTSGIEYHTAYLITLILISVFGIGTVALAAYMRAYEGWFQSFEGPSFEENAELSKSKADLFLTDVSQAPDVSVGSMGAVPRPPGSSVSAGFFRDDSVPANGGTSEADVPFDVDFSLGTSQIRYDPMMEGDISMDDGWGQAVGEDLFLDGHGLGRSYDVDRAWAKTMYANPMAQESRTKLSGSWTSVGDP